MNLFLEDGTTGILKEGKGRFSDNREGLFSGEDDFFVLMRDVSSD